ncbi:hypothetical protein OUZ56_001043 [Daphnia magna]|uniref:Uncharacterized protein n=1 Tax=Daphnia magna TaxID=35525 RepID=A0ABR0A1G6_9CRUS|nr:hypothetical protein OUZ56_001043 [Daphnia magna]
MKKPRMDGLILTTMVVFLDRSAYSSASLTNDVAVLDGNRLTRTGPDGSSARADALIDEFRQENI